MQTADPLRTPTYTLFPKPDYFFSTTGRRTVSINPRLRLGPRLLQPEHRHHLGRHRRPGRGGERRRRAGAGRRQPAARPEVDEHRSGGEPGRARGSRRPTSGRRCCTSLGLADDYQSDGHVITQALHASPAPRSRRRPTLAAGYEQINSSVGQFATDTLIADIEGARVRLGERRLRLHGGAGRRCSSSPTTATAAAATIKQMLSDAAAGKKPKDREVADALAQANGLLDGAATLAGL